MLNEDMRKLVQAMGEPNSNYDTVNDGIVDKLAVVANLMKGSPDEQCVIKDEINKILVNPDIINDYFS